MFEFLKKKTSIESSSLLLGGEDAHSHILYGVDDGIRDIESSISAIHYESSLGIASIYCTPHIMEDVPNTTDGLRRRFDELCAAYNGEVTLKLAAEYMIDNLFLERFKNRDLIKWGSDGVLVETSTMSPPVNLKAVLSDLMMAGYKPLLAHPERYRYLRDEDYFDLVESGVKLQLNLPSLVGRYGSTVMKRALWLLDKGMYSVCGSDCHRVSAIKDQYSAELLSSKTVAQLTSLISNAGYLTI